MMFDFVISQRDFIVNRRPILLGRIFFQQPLKGFYIFYCALSFINLFNCGHALSPLCFLMTYLCLASIYTPVPMTSWFRLTKQTGLLILFPNDQGREALIGKSEPKQAFSDDQRKS